ncbi:MAG TPA: flagellar hook capping FlgD N-terminal domain-containing protein [Nocardioides sp.]
MTVSATEGPTPYTSVFASSASASAAANDKQMFLELMVAQLRYQDPLNPTDSSEFLAQSAQFTALEKMQSVADQTAALLSSQMAFGAATLVGSEVSWTTADGTTRSGVVDSVSFGTEGPMLSVGSTRVPLAELATVSRPTPTS